MKTQQKYIFLFFAKRKIILIFFFLLLLLQTGCRMKSQFIPRATVAGSEVQPLLNLAEAACQNLLNM